MRNTKLQKEITITRRNLRKLERKAQMSQDTGEITQMINALDDSLWAKMYNPARHI